MVSVLISTYNRPVLVQKALESIYKQTYRNIEIILTRDGGCPVKPIRDPRLLFIDRDTNKGLAYSFNRALEIARGEYICYLGDDDIFYPHHVETLVNALDNSDCGAAYTDLYKTYAYVEPSGYRRVLAKNVEISRDFDRMVMMHFNHTLHCCLMHRRDLIKQTGLYNEKLKCLIDYDITRKICFFTDMLHVPEVTGEFYVTVNKSDRISTIQRESEENYLRHLITVRLTRPPKPWIIPDLSIIVPDNQEVINKIRETVFYPHELYYAGADVPGEYVAVLHDALREDIWLEKALWACMLTGDRYNIEGCGYVYRKAS